MRLCPCRCVVLPLLCVRLPLLHAAAAVLCFVCVLRAGLVCVVCLLQGSDFDVLEGEGDTVDLAKGTAGAVRLDKS